MLNRIRNTIKNEKGSFLALEWSVLLYVSILIIIILLPDLFSMGRGIFYTHQVASYGIQRAAENGRMTPAIANSMAEQLEQRSISEFRIYGSRGDVINNLGDSVDVHVTTYVEPRILSIMPNMRLSSTAGLEDGVLRISVHKRDVSTVHVRVR